MKKEFFWFIVALVLVIPMLLLERLPKGTLDPAIVYVISVVWGTMIGAYILNTIKKEKEK